jgi:hypothetical protein
MPYVQPIEALLLLGIAGAFLVLEEFPVSAAVDWALVMSLNTEIGVCPIIDLVSVLFLSKVKVVLHVCRCREVAIQAENAQSSACNVFFGLVLTSCLTFKLKSTQ